MDGVIERDELIKIGLRTGRHRDVVIQRDEDEDEGWRWVGRGYVPSTLISTATLHPRS